MTDLNLDIVTMPERATPPTATVGKAHLYTKDVGGVTHLYGVTGDGQDVQITPYKYHPNTVYYGATRNLITLGPYTGTNVTGIQQVFPSVRNQITLPIAGVYRMRGCYSFEFPTAVTLTISMAFISGATYSQFQYRVRNCRLAGANGPAVTILTNVATNASTLVTQSVSAKRVLLKFEGMFTCTAAGTFQPMISLNNLPGVGNGPVYDKSTYLELIQMAVGFTQQGGWG